MAAFSGAQVILGAILTMAILLLLPRQTLGAAGITTTCAAASRSLSNCGRLRPRRTILTNPSVFLPAFATPSITNSRNAAIGRPTNFHSGIFGFCHNLSRQGKQSDHGGSVVCFATAPSNGDDVDVLLDKLTVNELKKRLRAKGLTTSGLKADLIQRLSSTPTIGAKKSLDTLKKGRQTTRSKPTSSKTKFKVNPNWRTEFNATAVQVEFEKLAKKDGFDDSTAYFADEATFEDDFDGEEFDRTLTLDGDYINDDDFDLDDDEDDDTDEIPSIDLSPTQQSMEERLAAAKRDQSLGRITVPTQLDKFSQEVSFDDLRKLGFRREGEGIK